MSKEHNCDTCSVAKTKLYRSWIARSALRSLNEICVKQSKGLGLVMQVFDCWIIRKQYLQVLDR